MSLYFSLSVYSILFPKNVSSEKYEIAFSLPCRFSSLRILRFISANTKEFYKNYLKLKTPVLIRILRLTETQGFLSKTSVYVLEVPLSQSHERKIIQDKFVFNCICIKNRVRFKTNCFWKKLQRFIFLSMKCGTN